ARMLPMKSEKSSALGAAMMPPRPAISPEHTRIAPATASRMTGGTGSGSVSAHQKARPTALAAIDAKTRGQLIWWPARASGASSHRRETEIGDREDRWDVRLEIRDDLHDARRHDRDREAHSGDGREGVVGLIERRDASIVVDDRDVLDPHAEAPLEIDARLDR